MSAQLNKIRSWRIYVRRATIVNYYTGEKVIIYRMESFRTSEASEKSHDAESSSGIQQRDPHNTP